MNKIFAIAIAGLVFARPATAQINESDTVKLQARVSVTGNYQKGNVEVFTLRGRADFSVSPLKDFVFKTQNASLYQEFYGRKADNDIFSRNYFYFKPQQKIYPFAMIYFSANYRRKVDNRFFAGPGATLQVINKKENVLKVSGSVVYEHTLFNANAFNYSEFDSSSTINLWRGTAYIGGWNYLFDKHLRLWYDGFWQPAFNNANNYRTQFDIGLDFPVWKGLSFTTVYTYTHENVVVKSVKQDDRILSFGLSYNIKKI